MAEWIVQYAEADRDCDGVYLLPPARIAGDFEHEDDVQNAADDLIEWPEGCTVVDLIGIYRVDESGGIGEGSDA